MKYAGIINNDVVNGQDVCVSYWCQGCRFRCPGCQNPQTWDFNGGIEAKDIDIIQDVIEAISKNNIQRNLSILGGEPLCNENSIFTLELITAVKNKYPNIKIFLWTGYKWEDLVQFCPIGILNQIDVLIDGQFDLNNRDITLPFRGSTNQRVIDVQKSLKIGKVILWELQN